jgi:hypothetical protein
MKRDVRYPDKGRMHIKQRYPRFAFAVEVKNSYIILYHSYTVVLVCYQETRVGKCWRRKKNLIDMLAEKMGENTGGLGL